MKGYLFNSLLVAAGSIAGLVAGKRINENTKEAVFNVLGLITVYIGIRMSLNGKDLIPVVFCLVIGLLIGSMLRLDERVTGMLHDLNRSVFAGRYDIEGFLISSTLFCIGSMTIIGSLKDGLYNDGVLIRTKSIIDCFAAFVLASRYGPSVTFSALSILVVQGSLTLFSGRLSFLASGPIMNSIDGVGGIIVMAIGVNILKLKTIRTIDMLPALVLIAAYGYWLS